jgi:predicted kinase
MLCGAGETEKLPMAAYAPDVTARVYAAIADKARRIVAAGHSAIIDAVFATPQERDALAEAAKAAKISVQGLFLTADLATRIARVGGRTKDASDAGAAVAQAQENYDLGALEWSKIDASGTVVDTLARARAALSA